jgi:hypothetical protein
MASDLTRGVAAPWNKTASGYGTGGSRPKGHQR